MNELDEKSIVDFICWLDKKIIEMENFIKKEKQETGNNPCLDDLKKKRTAYETVKDDLDFKLLMLKNNMKI